MTRDEKKKIIAKYGQHAKDTGSAQVQIAILTKRITEVSKHLEAHPKDDHTRRGLLKMVGDRRRHLTYLKLNEKDKYEQILSDLKLRK